MILGFAHITRNSDRAEGGSWKIVTVPNAQQKLPLMQRRATAHAILFASQRGGLPEEVIMYDTGVVERKGRLRLGAGVVLIDARDPTAETSFFANGLGFHASRLSADGEERNWLEFRSQIQGWNLGVGIVPDAGAPIDPPLDIAGYAALAFYSSDVEADRDHLLKHGGRTPTEPFAVELDREMKIVMLRSPEGTIIELIQVLT